MKIVKNKTCLTLIYLVYGLLGFVLVSCSKEVEPQIIPSKPIYLGAYYVADILSPFPQLLTFEGDTAILIDNKGMPQDTAVLIDSMLLFKKYNFYVYRKTVDQLTIMAPGYRNRKKSNINNIIFRNVTNKPKQFNGDIRKIIADKTWNYEARYLTPMRIWLLNISFILKPILYVIIDTTITIIPSYIQNSNNTSLTCLSWKDISSFL